jgi:peptidoglycan/xylan/chitin deacetylase (PgdA/CDA1 family)
MQGTFYVSSGFVDANAAGYMPSWDLDNLYRDGNEIGGSTTDHKDLTQTYFSDPAQDLAYKTSQVCGDRTRLAQLGYDPQSFAYPTGAYNTTAEQIVAGCGYLSARAIGKLAPVDAPAYAERIPPRDPMAVRTLDLLPGPVTLQWLKDSVLAAADNGGGWLPIGFNQVCSQADANYSTCMSAARPIDAAVLSAFLDWLQTSAPAGTQVKTVRAVMGAAPQPTLPPRQTKVSITFDDGLVSQYQTRAMFSAHGIDATFYINSGPVDAGEQGTMTWAQIHNLESDGHEIAGHTVDHVSLTDPATTENYKRDQVCRDRARLQEQGFNPVSFAYPFATFNAAAEVIVQDCGYQSGRTGGTLTPEGPHYSELIPPKDAYAIRILGTTYNGPITLQVLEDAVNGAATHGGGWLPMLFHEVCFGANENFANCMNGYRPVSDTTLDAFLGWLDTQQSNGVSTATMSQVMGGNLLPEVIISEPAEDEVAPTGQPTISGTADAQGGNVTVELFSGSQPTGTPLMTLNAVNSGGTWSTSPSTSLADGTYTVQAHQILNGKEGVSAPITFSVLHDTSAPVVTISSPADQALLNTATPTVSGTAGTAPGDDGHVSVAVYAGNAATGAPVQNFTAAVGAGGGWSGSPSALSDGSYTFQATQTDSGGNVGTSAARTVTIDTTGPAVTISSPAQNAAITTSTLSVAGSAGTASGDAGTVTLRMYAGSSVAGTLLSTQNASVSSGAWSVNLSGLTVGTYTLQASQSDSAGNTGQSAAVTFTVGSSMTVSSVSPNTAGTGAIGRLLTVQGSGFTAGSSVSISGTGVTTGTTTFVNASTLTVPVDVAASAPIGARNIVVSQTGVFNATCANCLTINAGPTATSMSPNSLGQGAVNASVRLNGTGMVAGSVVTFSGTGVTATITTVRATSVQLSMNVGTNATVGTRDVTVTNPDGGRATCNGCFQVLAGPKVVSLSPSSVPRNASTVVTMTGSGFAGSLEVTFSGSGVTGSTLTVVNATTLRVTVKVTKAAATGLRDVTVSSKTNLGQSTLVGGLRIT